MAQPLKHPRSDSELDLGEYEERNNGGGRAGVVLPTLDSKPGEALDSAVLTVDVDVGVGVVVAMLVAHVTLDHLGILYRHVDKRQVVQHATEPSRIFRQRCNDSTSDRSLPTVCVRAVSDGQLTEKC